MLLTVLLAVAAGLVLVRRMVRPIHALGEGAARLGAGELSHRIDVHTGDELQALAEQFNRMGDQLQESYAGLERKVEERTRELSEALERQTATAEILRAISSSPTELEPVLETVAQNAARLCGGRDVAIVRVEGDHLRLVTRLGPFAATLPDDLSIPADRGSVVGRAVVDRATVHIADLEAEPEDRWLVPIGVGAGRVFAGPVVAVELELGAYWNVVRPETEPAARWAIEARVNLLLHQWGTTDAR